MSNCGKSFSIASANSSDQLSSCPLNFPFTLLARGGVEILRREIGTRRVTTLDSKVLVASPETSCIAAVKSADAQLSGPVVSGE